MIKSTTFVSADQETTEHKIVQNSNSIMLDNTIRQHLFLDGGRCYLSVTTSINILYMDTTIGTTINVGLIILPFKCQVENDVIEILFDEVELSPVYESDEIDLDDVVVHKYYSEVVSSLCYSCTVMDNKELFIEPFFN